MSLRIQVILDEAEQERIRREAERLGVSVSAWMREAARRRLSQDAEATRLDSPEELARFFADCDARAAAAASGEPEREPDWEEQRTVIDSSRGSGASDT